MSRLWLFSGAVYGLLGVALGAFGAHALRERLAPDLQAIYRTAVEYQFWHALALLALGVWSAQRPAPLLDWAGGCLAVGVLLFSGSLYALALSGVRALGAVTPVGGLLFLAGWGLMAWTALRQ